MRMGVGKVEGSLGKLKADMEENAVAVTVAAERVATV
jgi:hypothetical protein